jgi:hypothetical protein
VNKNRLWGAESAETAQHWFCQGSSNECRGK